MTQLRSTFDTLFGPRLEYIRHLPERGVSPRYAYIIGLDSRWDLR